MKKKTLNKLSKKHGFTHGCQYKMWIKNVVTVSSIICPNSSFLSMKPEDRFIKAMNAKYNKNISFDRPLMYKLITDIDINKINEPIIVCVQHNKFAGYLSDFLKDHPTPAYRYILPKKSINVITPRKYVWGI
jgi:hypothetical protein